MRMKFFYENFAIWTVVVFILGVVTSFLGILGTFMRNSLPDFLSGIKPTLDAIGDWNLWLVIVGPLLLVTGGWYVFDRIASKREFAGYMEANSKAVFVKNRQRVEELAWKLGSTYREKVSLRLTEYKIRR